MDESFEPIEIFVACCDSTLLSVLHEISSRDNRIKVHSMDPKDFLESFLWRTSEQFQYDLLLFDLALCKSFGFIELSQLLDYDWTVILLGEVPPSTLHDLERNSKVFTVFNNHANHSMDELRFIIYRALQHRFLQMYYSAHQNKQLDHENGYEGFPKNPMNHDSLKHSSPMDTTSTTNQPTKKRKSVEGDTTECSFPQPGLYPLVSPSYSKRRTSLDNEPLIIPIHYRPSPLEPSTASWADIAHSLFYDLTGERFFQEAARYLSKYLKISCACIGEYTNTDTIKIWSICMDKEPTTDHIISIANTPLQVLAEDCQGSSASAARSCLVYNGNALKSFPKDSFLHRHQYISCICCTLTSDSHLGVIAVCDTKEFEDVDFVTSVLKLFAVRASSEMERLKMEHAVSHRLAMEYALTSISTLFIKDYISDKKSCIDYALKTMCELLGAERACMFQVMHDCETLSLIADWVAPSGKPLNPNLRQGVSLREFPLDMDSLQNGDIVRGHILNAEPSEPKSFIYVPIMDDGKMVMFFGFDFFSIQDVVPQDSDIFRMLSQIIGYSEQRLKTKEELIIARDLAEAGNRSKSEFLGMVSHELRTPLNGIIANTLFLLDTDLTPIQKEYAHVTRTCGEALLRIINDVTDFTQMESGQLLLNVGPFSLKNCIEGSLAMLSPVAALKNIQFSLSLDPKLPVCLRGDPTRISQVICNICSNAIKFTDRGNIHVGCCVNRLDSQKCKFTISVKDSGIGLSDDDMHRIFQPFTQVDSSNTRRFQGTGIGLTLCRKILNLMGGEIWVQSKGRGQGAIFSFSLELPLDSTAPVMASKTVDNSQRDISVLVVDDNLVNQTVMTKMLRKIGYSKSDIASNGLECLEKLNKKKYDLVFLDLMMPLMDGFTCFENFKNSQGRPWVVAMTAQAYDADKKACLSAGMEGYLTKPIVLEDLMENLMMFQQKRKT